MNESQINAAAAPVYKRRRGDRKDGRLIRSIEPMTLFALYVMETRNDANNYITDSVDLEAIDKYVHKKRLEGFEGLNAMYVFVAAYVRGVSQKPGVNRFVNGHRIYARNTIEVSMAVKKSFSLNAPETMLKFLFKPEDTINDVYKEMHTKIVEYQNEPDPDGANDMDKFLRKIFKLPRWILRLFMIILYKLD